MPAGNCERCGTHRRFLHRHHVKPRNEGGTDADGIELVCANCHEDIHGSPFGNTVRAARRRKAREEAIPAAGLRRLYHDEHLTIRQIAERLETAPSNVQFWMRDYGIERRAGGTHERVRPSRETLVALLAEHRRVDIARMYGVSRTAVSKWAKLYGIDKALVSTVEKDASAERMETAIRNAVTSAASE